MSKIRAQSSGKGQAAKTHIYRPGKCCLCPSTWGLTKHHVFGSKDKITMQLCANCHTTIHNEVNNANIGPFTRHAFAILTAVFPIVSSLPEWKDDD